MESGKVQLDDNTVAPAIVLKSLDDETILLRVFLESGDINYRATRGDSLDDGVFVSDG